jgi:hypothetical protein
MNSDSAANSASSRFISRLKSRSQAIWRIPVLLLSLLILAAPQAHAQTSPVLDPIGNRSVNEGALLTFTATASDDDVGDTLTFSLDPGAPVGAAINPLSGVFTWTPTEAQGPANRNGERGQRRAGAGNDRQSLGGAGRSVDLYGIGNRW